MAAALARVAVSRRVSALSWRPGAVDVTRHFIYGGTDDADGEGALVLCRLPTEDDDEAHMEIAAASVPGAVADACFISPVAAAACTTAGRVCLFELSDRAEDLEAAGHLGSSEDQDASWNEAADRSPAFAWGASDEKGFDLGPRARASRSPRAALKPVADLACGRSERDATPATSVALLNSGLVAAANERGDLVLLDPAASASRDAARRIPEANSAPIYDMVANSPQTLAAACMSGRLVLWDTRLLLDGNRRPSLICASENGSLLSVAAHRARPYLFATGSANGVLETWDTRNYSSPLLSVVTHDAAIWSLSFLDTSSTQIVSCGEDGGLFLWEFNKDRRDPIQVEFSRAQQSNILVRRLHKAPLPLNVLACDLQTQTVLAGCDDDSLLVLRNA